jgi:signal transduction histidine kinase
VQADGDTGLEVEHDGAGVAAERRAVVGEEPLPADCKGLSLELKEAAGNLIANAIKYTPAEGVIKVSLTSDNGHWVFKVVDNGYGIDPARQERLFESFYRAQQPGTENIKGTGLGLSLVKEIIVKHDGEVFFESTPGKGSTFGFWLPGI